MKLAVGVLGGTLVAALVGLLGGCTQTIQYPVPTVSSLSPGSVQAGGAAFTLTVNGKNFVFGGGIFWNGSAISTLYVTSGELQAQIDPSFINTPGSIAIQVFNPSPGGGFSNSVYLTINPAPSPIPAISSLQPSSAQANGASFTLTVNGSNFVPTSTVTWNGANLPTAYANNGELQAAISSTLIDTPGVVSVAVLNPVPDGGLSNTVSFPVNNPSPVITSISPLTSIAAGPAITLAVNGGGYTCAAFTTTNGSTSCTTSESLIEWNGTPVATTFLSSIQLAATLSTGQLNQAGTNSVTVFNPSPGGGTSASANFQVIPGANGQGLPSLVDVASDGTQANDGIGNLGKSGPGIGGGGRFIAFSSISQNLVSNLANGVANVFVRDTCLGISSGCTPGTVLASVANSGQPANADSLDPSLSSDGRYVAFSSAATNLVSTVTSGAGEIYLHDACFGATSGCSPFTSLVSVAADGVSAANGSSTQPVISPDGQYVVFVSTATNLVAQATTGAPEIYIRSTCLAATGPCTPATALVSVAPDGVTPADGSSATPAASSGGRYVAFESSATNLVSVPTSGSQQLYWRDTCIGAPSGCTPATTLVSVASNGTSPGNGPSGSPAISADGRYVVFSSQASDLIGAGFVSGTPQQIYERDLCVGASGCAASTSLVSVAADGSSPANAAAASPDTDQSGRYVLFSSKASNLTSAAVNGFAQVFARDTCIGASTGCTPATTLVSAAAGGSPLGNGDSLYPAITTQAHFAVFLSFANNVVADDTTPTLEDIFLDVTGF